MNKEINNNWHNNSNYQRLNASEQINHWSWILGGIAGLGLIGMMVYFVIKDKKGGKE